MHCNNSIPDFAKKNQTQNDNSNHITIQILVMIIRYDHITRGLMRGAYPPTYR
ncbi:hypothetical protein Hanom_Chr04g00320131 [Helianthus anomalus]